MIAADSSESAPMPRPVGVVAQVAGRLEPLDHLVLVLGELSPSPCEILLQTFCLMLRPADREQLAGGGVLRNLTRRWRGSRGRGRKWVVVGDWGCHGQAA